MSYCTVILCLYMKLLAAVIIFVATLGMLFLIETGKSPKEDSAQIIEALKEENKNTAASATPSPIKARVSTPTPTLTPAHILTPLSSPVPIQTPVKTSSPTPKGAGQGFIDIISVTSPVKQNDDAQVSIATTAGALCSIKVILPSDTQSTAKGLETKTADASGNITWSWKINWNTTTGTATIEISCSKDGQSFSKSLQMAIVER